MGVVWLVCGGGLLGCGELDTLVATFGDELVEAQARTVEVKVVDNAACANLLRVEHADVESVANVIAVRTTTYPINPESGILEDLPRNRPLIFDVAAFDRESRLVARACQGVTLPADDATEIVVEMRALPTCDIPPTALDIAVVFDASRSMRVASLGFEGDFADQLAPLFAEPIGSEEDRWTLVVHGPTMEPEVRQSWTNRPLEILDAIRGATAEFAGVSRVYDATRLGTVLVRAQAVCGRRQVVLVLSGGRDAGPPGGRELAISGLVGDRGDDDDDLYGFGIGFSSEAKSALERVLVEHLGDTQAALTRVSLDASIRAARGRFRAFISPSP